MSPESYCEMINLENLSLPLCRTEQQVEPRCANHGREEAASWTGRVSSYKRNLQRTWAATVSNDRTTHTLSAWFPDRLRQHKLYGLTDKQYCVLQLVTEGSSDQNLQNNWKIKCIFWFQCFTLCVWFGHCLAGFLPCFLKVIKLWIKRLKLTRASPVNGSIDETLRNAERNPTVLGPCLSIYWVFLLGIVTRQTSSQTHATMHTHTQISLYCTDYMLKIFTASYRF